ncbi:transposase [Zobellia uliginosa]|uniref:transposase n=1 Tax=Zobellia uliginosa TaxID=143224 RepID=UPI0026E3281F|nr:transposase [Zobellia uliginosa]MDO6516535.1 transposase [Zobellia uliginosa]
MQYEPIRADHYYHIYNQGNNRENIFVENRNYAYFLRLMHKYLDAISDIYAYCLLKNHFHIVLKFNENVADKVISQKLSNLFNSYAKAINKAYHRTGSLFRDRFRRKRIEDENYLKNLIVYVHLNPEHHGFTNDFRRYKYSSYSSYLSDLPSKLDREFILGLFEDRSNFVHAHLNKKMELEKSLTLE